MPLLCFNVAARQSRSASAADSGWTLVAHREIAGKFCVYPHTLFSPAAGVIGRSHPSGLLPSQPGPEGPAQEPLFDRPHGLAWSGVAMAGTGYARKAAQRHAFRRSGVGPLSSKCPTSRDSEYCGCSAAAHPCLFDAAFKFTAATT